jgi:hypothetical protein
MEEEVEAVSCMGADNWEESRVSWREVGIEVGEKSGVC